MRARCSVCGGVIGISAGTLPVSITPGSTGAVQQGFIASVGNGGNAGHRNTPAATSSARSFAAPTPSVSSAAAAPAPVAPAFMTPPVPAGMMGMTGMAAASRGAPARTSTPALAAVAEPSASPPPATMTSAMASAMATSPMPTPARRPINPFLNADPGQRARRLARALVSDLVAYHPQKREEGLRDGTLRQLFRDEIKKSYEEYVEQVGRELADGSPHFQDALNDILGGGRKLF
ncbi:MAG TPA: hypothetical protein VE869_17565 [Gemmatimonas sp.]|nr:hypothetical protein [Gemmatimonas sp.]